MPQTPPQRDWIHYVIVLAVAGLVGSGIGMFISNKQHAKDNPPPADFMNVTPDSNASSEGSETAPAEESSDGNTVQPAPSTNQEPPPMLAGNLPAPEAAVTLGNWYFDHQNWKKAIEKYEEAIDLGQDNPDVRTDLGSAYRFSGDAQKALEEYERAHEMDPQHEHSLFNQGAVYVLMLNDPQKGVDIWKEYLKEFPNGDSAENAKKLIAEAEEKYQLRR